MQRLPLQVIALLFLVFSQGSYSEVVRVAAASNFYTTLIQLVEDYSLRHEFQVEVISGSSGKLASQIIQGAPFDLFFSADVARPLFLEEQGLIVENSRRTYALGQLALVAEEADPLDKLLSGQYRQLAVANPDLAPYGLAAIEFLEANNIEVKGLVYGESVSQAYHYLQTGNADLALVSLAQILIRSVQASQYHLISAENYHAIEQQVVLLNEKMATLSFNDYLSSADAAGIILSSGYLLP